MNVTDSIVEGLTSVLVRLLLRPRVYCMGSQKQEDLLKEPSILIINHTSHLDGPVVTTALRQARIHNLAAKDRFEQKGFGFFLRHTGCIPIDRKTPDLSWVHEALRVLTQEKECVAIFPEGAHGEHRRQLPFHPGAAMLASFADVPLVMVYVDGPHKILGRRSKLLISEPFRLEEPQDGFNTEYYHRQTEILQKKMKDMTDYFCILAQE